MAARMLATLDQMSNGRAGVHIITAFSDIETRCDGDYLTKDERYHRSREYVGILREIWGATAPVDHDGRFYRFEQAQSEVKPVNGTIPSVADRNSHSCWGFSSPASTGSTSTTNRYAAS